MTEENKDEKTTKIIINSKNIWRYTTIALLVIVVLLLAVFLWNSGGNTITGSMLLNQNENENDIANKTVEFLNKNIISGDAKASLDSVTETSGILNITVLYQSRKIPIYATTDGKFLILPGGGIVDMTQPLPQAEEPEQQQPTETPKTDKPTVQLFVMAFCPYGIQAENAMKPVVDLLGSKADIKVHFIANVGGTTPDTVQSLHGTPEAQEDLRQVCIMKYYDQKAYWNYLMKINADCSSKYKDTTAYDTCWKDAAKQAGIDASKIDTCSKSEGVSLLKTDADLSSSKGVSGSPTLIINGINYNGARSPDAYKESICNAFTTVPSECSTVLSSTATTTSGGCAS
jgi:glutaredoxin